MPQAKFPQSPEHACLQKNVPYRNLFLSQPDIAHWKQPSSPGHGIISLRFCEIWCGGVNGVPAEPGESSVEQQRGEQPELQPQELGGGGVVVVVVGGGGPGGGCFFFVFFFLHLLGGGSFAEPVRVAEAAGLEYVRAVPAEPPTAAVAVAVQQRARAGVPAVPGPVREDQDPLARVPLLRPPQPAGALPLPAPPGLGQPRRPHRPPPRRLRRERRPPGDQPLRRPRRPPLPPRGPRRPVQGQRHQLREEETQEATAASSPPAPRSSPSSTARRRRLILPISSRAPFPLLPQICSRFLACVCLFNHLYAID